MPKTFNIATLGCKLNYSESSHIARELQGLGFENSAHPDYFILNTCTVTSIAEKKARTLIAQFHRENPNAEIIVIGCFTARDKNLVENLPGVTKVFGSEDKMNIISYLLEQNSVETSQIPNLMFRQLKLTAMSSSHLTPHTSHLIPHTHLFFPLSPHMTERALF